MNLKKYNLDGAEKAYAASNTPQFLLRKLRSESAIITLSRECDATELLTELAISLNKQPEKISEAVLPYVLLVALALKSDASALMVASNHVSDRYKWYSFFVDLLSQSRQVTNTQSIGVLSETRAHVGMSVKTAASTKTVLLGKT